MYNYTYIYRFSYMELKISFSLLSLIFLMSCGEQPNRPVNLIDRVDSIYQSPSPDSAIKPSVIPSTSPVDNKNIIKVVFKGTVSNIVDKKPIEGAKVQLGTFSAITDASGNFSVNDVPIGIYYFTITKEGFIQYIDDTMEIKANFGKTESYLQPVP